MGSIAIAVGYLCAAILIAFLPAADRVGTWLPLHLALAGGASTAIAGVMPFFSAAFAAAPPVDSRLRWSAVAAVALGAAAVTVGFPSGATTLAAAGGALFIIGIGLVGLAVFRPLRYGLGPRGGLVTRGYTAALLMVGLGALLATLFLAGWPPAIEAWGHLRPAHAWLNLVGFVSLVIATTLLHFFPTVIGARIAQTRSAHLTVFALAVGTPIVALGFVLQSDLLARIGAALVAVGALALATYALTVWRTRAQWSSDPDWHLFAMGGLVSAIVWFEIGILLATSQVMIAGADPAAVQTDPLIGPLVLGWMGLAVLASATHLVPAVGPGDSTAHARQRRILGRFAPPRLVAANAGIVAVSIGLALELDILASVGIVTVAVMLGATAVLLIVAVSSGLRATAR
jgi:nitrite reductase (NO-forming)